MSSPTSDITLIIPPFTQLNTPYPSITYLHRYLKSQGYTATLIDGSIEVALKIFSSTGLQKIFEVIDEKIQDQEEFPEEVWFMIAHQREIISKIDLIVAYLQGKLHTLHVRIHAQKFVPKTPRLQNIDLSYFGSMGSHDASKYLCTLFLEDITDLIKCCIDIGFDFGRYQSHLATGAITLDPIIDRLHQTTLIDTYIDELADTIHTSCIAISIPFAGTLYAALRMGKRLKERGIKVWLGGGYVNTELREINDQRIWNFCDAICYDNGEEPLIGLLRQHKNEPYRFIRTITSEKTFWNENFAKNPFTTSGDYGNLPLQHYLQLLDSLSPAHRMWSDGRWNKFTIAHGCYWKKCSFCDIHLDYISRYVPAQTQKLVDEIEEQIATTGITGFHFVDEAAPPKALKEFALEVIRRDLQISFWGNIRFEKAFTPDLCKLLARAGLIMVTGGLEVAEQRLLQKMNKGVTIEQVIHCSKAFQDAGILVHAYLMYGFPTQTEKDTLTSMEMVRQLFEAGLLNSAFWHRFVLTRHSGVFAEPQKYDIEIPPQPNHLFATNDIDHTDLKGGNHDIFDEVLPFSLRLWMRGENLDVPVWKYFRSDLQLPKIQIPKDFVKKKLQAYSKEEIKDNSLMMWLGSQILETEQGIVVFFEGQPKEIHLKEHLKSWFLQHIDLLCTNQPIKYSDITAGIQPTKQLKRLIQTLQKYGLIFIS